MDKSVLTASQLRKRIDHSREYVIFMPKGTHSRDVSPLFGQQSELARDIDRAKALKTLLEANARWNATRRDALDSDIRRLVDETSTINPKLRKELLYSCENGFIEDKPVEEQHNTLSQKLLRKDENWKSGKASTSPLKGKVTSQLSSTVKTAAGAIYQKSDIAQSRIKSLLPLKTARNLRKWMNVNRSE